jgi:hypothetical protein
MRKGTVHLKTGGMLLVIVMVFMFAAGAVKVDTSVEGPMKSGAGLIMIDTMKTFGPLERPPVPYFHSRHTETLAKINRDCNVCHMADEKGRLSPKYKRLAETDRQTVADVYHVNCIACHRELAGPGQEERSTNLRGVSPGKSRGCLHVEGSRLRQIPALPPCQSQCGKMRQLPPPIRQAGQAIGLCQGRRGRLCLLP